ncbi:MAG: RNA methyltransferase [Firmicutes bacterium HGW-Firmicutes-1]|jgi:putative N6-adenine-specific DNA methylase|nr:MAG: RNA methyltransferase [Firmicutes bacterium HGW-Firmicutes-1]
MTEYTLTIPCLFGIEAVVKKEIQKLGYNIQSVDDGRITFVGDAGAICKSNLWVRSGERVLLDIGQFEAKTFDELFEAIKKLPWEDYIPEDGKFWVSKASSIKSELFSPSDIQSIVKKAIVERLKKTYKVDWFKEDGPEFPMRVFIKKNIVSIGIDTSGASLHKRGYRQFSGIAPIRESLAAGIIQLSPWNKDRVFADPFCGSGTFPIEAAMMGANIAPGLNRSFVAESWQHLIPSKCWKEAVDEAKDLQDHSVELNIQAFDVDYQILKIARENAKTAGVDQYIHFQEREMQKFTSNKKCGVIVTNPPYGERLEDKNSVIKLYKEMGEQFRLLDTWSYSIITSFEDFERHFGKSADKKRKLYSGMLKTNLYQYLGPKPRYNS